MNPDDSVDLTRLSSLNSIKTRPVLAGSWTVLDSIGRSKIHRSTAAQIVGRLPNVFLSLVTYLDRREVCDRANFGSPALRPSDIPSDLVPGMGISLIASGLTLCRRSAAVPRRFPRDVLLGENGRNRDCAR